MKIGVLASQEAFGEHIAILCQLGVEAAGSARGNEDFDSYLCWVGKVLMLLSCAILGVIGQVAGP